MPITPYDEVILICDDEDGITEYQSVIMGLIDKDSDSGEELNLVKKVSFQKGHEELTLSRQSAAFDLTVRGKVSIFIDSFVFTVTCDEHEQFELVRQFILTTAGNMFADIDLADSKDVLEKSPRFYTKEFDYDEHLKNHICGWFRDIKEVRSEPWDPVLNYLIASDTLISAMLQYIDAVNDIWQGDEEIMTAICDTSQVEEGKVVISTYM